MNTYCISKKTNTIDAFNTKYNFSNTTEIKIKLSPIFIEYSGYTYFALYYVFILYQLYSKYNEYNYIHPLFDWIQLY